MTGVTESVSESVLSLSHLGHGLWILCPCCCLVIKRGPQSVVLCSFSETSPDNLTLAIDCLYEIQSVEVSVVDEMLRCSSTTTCRFNLFVEPVHAESDSLCTVEI